MKRLVVIVAVILFLLPAIGLADDIDQEHSQEVEVETAKGIILEVISEVESGDISVYEGEFGFAKQIVKLKILTGKYKDEEYIIEHSLSGNQVFDIKVEDGDKVLLVIEEGEDGLPIISISDFVRDNYLVFLLVLFAALLAVVGGVKGIKSIVTLSVTAIIILKIMLPLILKGYNPIWVSIVSSIVITLITLVIIAGVNIKSISAMIGTAGGVIFAATLAYFVGNGAKLSGLSSEEANMLLYIPQGIQFDFRGLLFAGIIIGTLGAVMDIGMSIASSMYEMREINPDITPKELMKSGLNVGKDVMGTMSNTLILAYTGSSIPLLLLFMSYDESLSKILNLDMMATEVVRSLAGSIGLVIAIPITALTTGLILKYKK